jgi:hypothetical protein
MLRSYYDPFSVTINIDDFLASIQVRKGGDKIDGENAPAIDACEDSSDDEESYAELETDPYGEFDADKVLLNLFKLWQMNISITVEPIKRSTDEDDAACPQPSPKRPRQSAAQELVEPAMVMSPGKRLHGKQAAELKPVRSAKLCQAPDCVYSRSEPGKPGRAVKTDYCIWCDPHALREALQDKYKLGHIKQTLTSFRARNTEVYESALSKLPPDFDDSAQKHPCNNPMCVFDRNGYGRPALTTTKFCIWCDEAAMQQATKSSYTIGRIKQSLSMFKAENMKIYEKACLRLPLGFDQGPFKHLCQSPGCVFSLQTPGSKARERRNPRCWWWCSHLCSWCDPKVLGARECTIQGVRLIVRGLNKFADKPEVLSAAWKKLSPNFMVQLAMGDATMRERRAMIDEDLVHQCKGRTEPYTTEWAMCGVCKVKPVGIHFRDRVKVFETIAAARAAAAGEARVPIERDADWIRILFAMDRRGKGAYCGCLGRRITLNCALCFDVFIFKGKNCRHYEGTGTCSTKKAPERNGYYCESKTGLHLVCLLHRAAEISAMWSNDKYVDQPELTLEQLCQVEEQKAREKLLSQERERKRECQAMLCEDYVMFEKVFLKVQLDPMGYLNPFQNERAFSDLAAGLTWLRAPSMRDDGILRLVVQTDSMSWKLPITSELKNELSARRAESPRWMWLYKGDADGARWKYSDARERATWGPSMFWSDLRDLHGWQTSWSQTPFPWVEMPAAMDSTIRLLRSRSMALTEDESRLRMMAWTPKRA